MMMSIMASMTQMMMLTKALMMMSTDDDVHIKTGCCGRSCPLIGRLTGPRHDMELTRSLSSMRKIMTRRRIGYGWAIIINVVFRCNFVKNIELHVFSSKHCLKIEMELTRSLSSMRKIMTRKKRRRIGEIMKTMILILSIGCFFDTYTRRLPWPFNLLLDVFPVLCHIV